MLIGMNCARANPSATVMSLAPRQTLLAHEIPRHLALQTFSKAI